jgi:hypothetical protein
MLNDRFYKPIREQILRNQFVIYTGWLKMSKKHLIDRACEKGRIFCNQKHLIFRFKKAYFI